MVQGLPEGRGVLCGGGQGGESGQLSSVIDKITLKKLEMGDWWYILGTSAPESVWGACATVGPTA